MSKQCVAIRHIHAEDLGSFADPIRDHGFAVEYVEAPALDPDHRAIAHDADLVVVLGGPIGAYEAAIYPFLRDEQELVARRVAAGRRTLGICLGAQIMARALGAHVYPSGSHEIGWSPLTRAPDLPASDPAAAVFGGADTAMMMHWHGDTFDLPAGARRLASTPLVREQAFAVGDHAIAWQCHPEFHSRGLEPWLVVHAFELSQRGGVELIERLRRDTAAHGPGLVARGRAFLDRWLA